MSFNPFICILYFVLPALKAALKFRYALHHDNKDILFYSIVNKKSFHISAQGQHMHQYWYICDRPIFSDNILFLVFYETDRRYVRRETEVNNTSERLQPDSNRGSCDYMVNVFTIQLPKHFKCYSLNIPNLQFNFTLAYCVLYEKVGWTSQYNLTGNIGFF